MIFSSKQIFFYLVIILTLITGLAAIYRLSEKADLPFEYHSFENKIFSNADYKDIHKEEYINNIDNFPGTSVFEIEFLLDSKRIGDAVTITSTDEKNVSKTSELILVHYYKNNFFILVSLIIGLSFWLTGVYVFAASPKDKSAKLLCLTLITFSLAILTSSCYFGRGADWMGYVIRILHSISYIFGSVLFLHFSLIYPNNFLRKQKLIITLLYITAIIFSIIISVPLFISMRDFNMNWLKNQDDGYYNLE